MRAINVMEAGLEVVGLVADLSGASGHGDDLFAILINIKARPDSEYQLYLEWCSSARNTATSWITQLTDFGQ